MAESVVERQDNALRRRRLLRGMATLALGAVGHQGLADGVACALRQRLRQLAEADQRVKTRGFA